MYCEILDADQQRTSAGISLHHHPSELPEFKKPSKFQVKTKGSAGDIIGHQQQLTSETGRALKNSLGEVITLKEAMTETVQCVELQLQQTTEQLCDEKTDRGNIEADLLETQEELLKTLGDFAAAAKYAERLNSQVNKLSSFLYSTEKENAEMQVEMVELRHELEEVTATLKTLQDQTNKTTDKLHERVTEVLDSLKKAKQELADKEEDNEMLQKRYKNAQDVIGQLKKSNEDLEDELRQAKDKVQQIAELQLRAARYEKLSQEMRKLFVQETGKNAELETTVITLSQLMARIQQESSNRIEVLQNTLTLRDLNVASLNQQLKIAQEAAVSMQIYLNFQRSEEMRHREKEKLKRAVVTVESGRYRPITFPERLLCNVKCHVIHMGHIRDKDSTPSDYPEAGMSSEQASMPTAYLHGVLYPKIDLLCTAGNG